MIYIPLDTNWNTNFFFAVNRIVTKIETTSSSIRGKPSHSFHHVGQFPLPLDPYNIRAERATLMNYLLRGHHHRVHERRYPYFSW